MIVKRIKYNPDFYQFDINNKVAGLKPLKPLTLVNSNIYDALISDYKILNDIIEFNLILDEIAYYDSYFVVFLHDLEKETEKRNIKFNVLGMNDDMRHFLDVLTPKKEKELESIKPSFWFEYISNIGKKTQEILSDTMLFIEFLGNLITKMAALLIKPQKMRWKDFPHHFTVSGIHAVPITTLIVFLIGLISGYQGALQLAQVGADKFIADLIGISITRELAPLMTAILIAGRSGSAFAAEIGSMKVSEEIDAMRSMGFDYMNFLVLPRVLSVMFAMPILVLITDIAGIAGGLVAAMSILDVTVAGYVNQLHRAIDFWDVFSGISKSLVFAFLISTIGCFRGMQVSGGAESVGKYTTASVVTSIFSIIIFDAMFTYIFQILGI